MDAIASLCDKLSEAIRNYRGNRLFTAAISGIDASGKGYIAKLVQEEMEQRGYRVANINIDPWQNPLSVRLQEKNAVENFYSRVFRWNDFFGQLIIPLQLNKKIHPETFLIRTDSDTYYPFTYHYDNAGLLMIQGILLLQEKYLSYYDYKIWIDCSFETGLRRAIARNVENLDEERLIHDYHTWYYPAQRLHFLNDAPREKADIFFNNE